MKKEKIKNNIQKKDIEQIRRDEVKQRLITAAKKSENDLMINYESSYEGLEYKEIKDSREKFGSNVVTYGNKEALFKKISKAFINPFTAILIVLAAVSFLMDVLLAEPSNKNPITGTIILTMVVISGLLRFIQETRSGNAAEALEKIIKVTTSVKRKREGKIEIPLDDVVVGDSVYLSAGDMVPADVRVLKSKDLFVSQATLTGESEPLEKMAGKVKGKESKILTDFPNLAFMGSNVISGSAICIVIATGNDTFFGAMSKNIIETENETSFEKGVNSVSWLLIRFMLVMVPIVLFINGFTKGDWIGALLFAISVAVGLTPEMLPMIVTTCLAKGAVSMAKKKTIIKNLNSIQNFGAMDILCTDKTGTLTQDKVVLEYHMDVRGNEDIRVLRHAFLNSYYQTGLKNLMDVSIIEVTEKKINEEKSLKELSEIYEKVDEIPFDFNRRRMSVVVSDKAGKIQMITKGAVEEMLKVCSHVEYKGNVELLTEDLKEEISVTVDELNDQGMRVIAVAQKTNPSPVGAFSVKDENNMVLIGYLAFLDPPKKTTEAAIKALKEYGVGVKILTGDNHRVTCNICRKVGIKVDSLILGNEIDMMSDKELKKVVEVTNVFAKLSPMQKARIVRILRENGHTVGFMGDGINDAAAMKEADVGISVDTAVDIAKESADVILLEKDLMVLEEGIIEGRKTYANMIKYIKMTASSNFGNMFSVLCASAFLPFLPMASIHLIVLNFIYDISCTAIPWDNVDEEFLKVPRTWNANSIGSFMIWMGPTSSVFDVATYVLMYFVICPSMSGGMLYNQITDPAMQAYYISIFQAGWFIESMWSQTLVIHMIRTPKIPFAQSRASLPVVSLTFTGIVVLTAIPFSKFGAIIGLAPLPGIYFAWLVLIIVSYMFLATKLKKMYIKKYGELL